MLWPSLLVVSTDAFRRRSVARESSSGLSAHARRCESELHVACAARLAELDAEARPAPVVAVATVDGVAGVALVLELDEAEPGLQSDVDDATVLVEQSLGDDRTTGDQKTKNEDGEGRTTGEHQESPKIDRSVALLVAARLGCRGGGVAADLDILRGGVARAGHIETTAALWRSSAAIPTGAAGASTVGARRRTAIGTASRRSIATAAAAAAAVAAAATTTIIVALDRGDERHRRASESSAMRGPSLSASCAALARLVAFSLPLPGCCWLSSLVVCLLVVPRGAARSLPRS